MLRDLYLPANLGHPRARLRLPPTPKKLRQLRSEIVTEKSRVLKPIEKRRDIDAWLLELEPVLAEHEEKTSEFERRLADLDRKDAGF